MFAFIFGTSLLGKVVQDRVKRGFKDDVHLMNVVESVGLCIHEVTDCTSA